MARRRGRYISVDTTVEVSLDDFDEEDILECADEIRKTQTAKATPSGVTAGLDFGALVLSFGSWEALKLREAVALGRAYEVLDIIRLAIPERELAA